MKDWHTENYKTLMKEIKEDTNKWKDRPFSWLVKFNSVKMSIPSKTIYRFNIIPNDIFKGTIKYNPKIHVEPQKIPNSQSNCKKEERSWRYHVF